MDKSELKNRLEKKAKEGIIPFFEYFGKHVNLVNEYGLKNFIYRMIYVYRLDDDKRIENCVKAEISANWDKQRKEYENKKKEKENEKLKEIIPEKDNDSANPFYELGIIFESFNLIENKVNEIKDNISAFQEFKDEAKNEDPITEEDRIKRNKNEEDEFREQLRKDAETSIYNLLYTITIDIFKVNIYCLKTYCLDLIIEYNLFDDYDSVVKPIEIRTYIDARNYSEEKRDRIYKAADYILYQNNNVCLNNIKTLKEYYDKYLEINDIRNNFTVSERQKYPKEIRIQANYGAYTKNENGEKADLSNMFPDNSEIKDIDRALSEWARSKYKVFRRKNNVDKDKYEEEGRILAKKLQKELLQYGIFVTYNSNIPINKSINGFGEEIELPKELLISADYGTEYLLDEKGYSNTLLSYFPESETVNELENELTEWADWFADTYFKPIEEFPWDEFNKVGRELAKRVYHLVKNKNISVYYMKATKDNCYNKEELIIEEEIKERLNEITIMADYDEYAWTEGVCVAIDISYYFPEISEIKEIEEELKDWLKIFLNSDVKSKEFDWDYFHSRGRDLARRLHNVLKEYNIPVYYWKPFEDKSDINSERELIE